MPRGGAFCRPVFSAPDSTPQNIIKRAYEQSPVAVHAWLDDPSPAIVEPAKIDVAAFHIIFNLHIE